MKRPLDLDALARKLPTLKARLDADLPARQRLGLLFRIAVIEEALSQR